MGASRRSLGVIAERGDSCPRPPGVLPGEARALDVADYSNRWLTVDRAMKGTASDSPIRGPTTGKTKRLPVGDELAEWIEDYVDPSARLVRAPLSSNPRTGVRWSHWGAARPLGSRRTRPSGSKASDPTKARSTRWPPMPCAAVFPSARCRRSSGTRMRARRAAMRALETRRSSAFFGTEEQTTAEIRLRLVSSPIRGLATARNSERKWRPQRESNPCFRLERAAS